MLLRIIRWFRGYIVFSISGKFPERFLNLINNRGIRHWDFIPSDGGYSGNMFLSDYLKIRPVARASTVKLRVRKKVGFPFFIKKYRQRKGLLVGAILAVIILVVMSRFVWGINLKGAEGLSETKLYSVFEECGFKVGMLKSSLDVDAVERQIELKIPEVRWLSVNMLNNVATVEIKQLAESPKMESQNYPCNIKASSDGVITDIAVKNGTCEVKRGSAVVRNQLLVNSVVAIGEDRQKYVHSDADIYADVKDKQEFIIPKKKNSIILNSNYSKKAELNFLFINIPVEFSPSQGGIEASNSFLELLEINGAKLPLGRTTRRSYYFSQAEKDLTEAQAEHILRTRMTLYECFNESKSTIKTRKPKLTQNDKSYILQVNYLFNKNIAQKQKITIE